MAGLGPREPSASTAGNLVFQGRGSGELWFYAADSGKVLKTIQTAG